MNINFIDNNNISNNSDKYMSVIVCSNKIIKSWRESLFSFEWLMRDGNIKIAEQLSDKDQEKRKIVDGLIKNGSAIEKPVLGIGLLENIEIGIGKEVFLTLAANKITEIEVHIPKSNMEDFDKFLT